MLEFSEEKVDKRQLKALLRAAWKTDLRGSSNPMNTAGSSSKFPPIVGVLIMQALVGAGMAAFTFVIQAPFLSALAVYTVVTVFVAIMVLLEFSNLILSPDEYVIVASRPIGSRTFYSAKLIHLLAYVNLLGLVIYSPSAVTLALANGNPLLFVSFFLGGLLLSTTIGMSFVLFYTLMLKIVNRDVMQRVLGYTQLVLTFIIYFGYIVVPRLIGRESLLTMREFHSDWLYLAPPAWFAALAKLPTGAITLFDATAIVIVVAVLYSAWKAATSRLSLAYAQTLASTISQQENRTIRSRYGIMTRLIHLFANFEDRAVWSLIRKQFKHDNRFKMSILTIIPLACVYMFLGISDGDTLVNPFMIATEAGSPGMTAWLYIAVAMLPFMTIVGTANSESYRSAWVFYTSPANRAHIILSSARFALIYFCFPFTLLLFGVFAYFFSHPLHAALHCVLIFVLLMVSTKLMVLIYPRIPFSQPSRTGQRSLSFILMVFVGLPIMIAPMVIVSKIGYGGYGGYALYLAGALLVNFMLQFALKRTIPRRAAKLEFTAPV